MNKSQVIEAVNLSMIEGFEIPQDQLKPEATLFEDLELDSLDAVDMLVHLEEKLGIKVDPEKFREVRSLQNVYDLVFDMASSAPQA